MTLSLDSNVLIDLVNGDDADVRDAFVAARRRGEVLTVSPQAIHETAYGALISTRPLHQTELLHRVLSVTQSEAFTLADAHLSAGIRADRRRVGRAIGAVDAMIASQALARGWTVVTADEDDFAHIPGLTVLNWRVPKPTTRP